MENAAKALEMAGSVLIGILILGCLVFGYSKISETKSQEATAEEIAQATDFNKAYEAYNRDDLYGSDIFSIANMVEDYKEKESGNKGYQEITISVKITNAIKDADYFKKMSYNSSEICNAYNELSSNIKNLGNNKYYGRTVSYWSNYKTGSSTTNLLNKVNQDTGKNLTDSSIQELSNKIDEYKALVSEQKDMARKTFKCKNVVYDDKGTGRVIEMYFEET